jgi:hypothetical protein
MTISDVIKQKYPKSYNNIISGFNNPLDDYKNSFLYYAFIVEDYINFNVAILNRDIIKGKYINFKAGAIFIVGKIPAYDHDENYENMKLNGDFTYLCTFKCNNPNTTKSGLISFCDREISFNIVNE